MPKLSERMQNTKSRTFLILGLVILAVIGVIIYFFVGGSSSSSGAQQTTAVAIPQISSIPGGATSERYQKFQEQENKRRAETAAKTGTSEVATIIGTRGTGTTGSESFGIDDLLKKECKCPVVPGACAPDLATKLMAQLDADPTKGLQILRDNPCLIKTLCAQNHPLAIKIMEKSVDVAKMMLNDCPDLAAEFAEKDPAMFKKLMLDNPELARKLAAANPELFKKLMLSDPAFARALAKSNPELVQSLMAGDPAFAAALRKAVPGIDKILADALAAQNPELAKRLEAAAAAPVAAVTAQAAAQSAQDRKNQLQALVSAMEGQSKSIYQAWNEFNPQVFVQGDWVKRLEEEEKARLKEKTVVVKEGGGGGVLALKGGATIKAGTVYYAVLDTSISSDEPSPILATIVEGPYKGSKLVGAFTAAPQPGGLPAEKLIVNFTTMNIPEAPASISINAVAIDPDTARTALATDVDHHYLLRYGTIFASAFLVGYAKVLTSQGSVQTTSANGLSTTTTSATLNNRQQILAALGQVGQQLGQSWKAYSTIPPTVTVDQGTGVGILFLSDVSG